jgi:glycosyltransferase involved in cell wall biosynthesis
MNAAAFAAISRAEIVHYAGPVNPPVLLAQKVRSKLMRLAGSRGDFFFFSQRRLEAIAQEVHARRQEGARLDFFHGFTPWVLTRPPRPYIAWSDCTFRDYIDHFHDRTQFREQDLRRIEQAEANWLKGARSVLFTSDWAAARAIGHYALDDARVASVGIFGEIGMPEQDPYAGGREFAFVSTNFEAKGGRTALAALREVRATHPEASLIVVGDHPSDVRAQPGVEFAGSLRKEDPAQHGILQSILGRVRALVHPTKSDITPLIVVEAGYFGCPVISSKRFAISELVDDSRTGLLLDDASRVTAVTGAMNWMLEHEAEYRQMRQAAWAKAHKLHSRQRFEERLLSFVCERASGETTRAA